MFLTSRFFFVDESAVVSALGTECGAQNKSWTRQSYTDTDAVLAHTSLKKEAI
jgi:hypothetical protein